MTIYDQLQHELDRFTHDLRKKKAQLQMLMTEKDKLSEIRKKEDAFARNDLEIKAKHKEGEVSMR